MSASAQWSGVMVVAAAQQPADAVERVIAATAVPGLLALVQAYLVDGGEPEAHDVKRVQHSSGVRQRGAQRGRVAAIGVQRPAPAPANRPRTGSRTCPIPKLGRTLHTCLFAS